MNHLTGTIPTEIGLVDALMEMNFGKTYSYVAQIEKAYFTERIACHDFV